MYFSHSIFIFRSALSWSWNSTTSASSRRHSPLLPRASPAGQPIRTVPGSGPAPIGCAARLSCRSTGRLAFRPAADGHGFPLISRAAVGPRPGPRSAKVKSQHCMSGVDVTVLSQLARILPPGGFGAEVGPGMSKPRARGGGGEFVESKPGISRRATDGRTSRVDASCGSE